MDRRKLLQVTLIGGAAAAAGATALPQAALADDIYQVEIGELTLGAILRTYVAAAIGASGDARWSYETSRTDSFGLKLSAGNSLKVSSTRPSITIGPITLGGGSNTVSYGSSTEVDFTVAYRVTSQRTFFTDAPGTINTADDTVFILLYKPVFKIFQDYIDGYPLESFRFDLVRFGGFFTRTARDLRRDSAFRADIGVDTADSILREYPLLETDSAEAIGLGSPRFIKYPNESSTTPQNRSDTFSGSATFSVSRTSSYSVNITSSGISSTFFPGFGTDSTFTVTTSAKQELAVQNIVSYGIDGWNSHGAINSFYQDVVYMTQAVGYEGGGVLAFSGTVRSAGGAAIPGAVVTLVSDEGVTRTTADANGHYALRTSKPLASGQAKLTCGGTTKKVTVGKGASRVDYAGVSPELARIAPKS